MGVNTVNVNGTNVYKGQQQNFAQTNTMLKEVHTAREQIKNDPNLSPEQKKTMLNDLAKAEQALMRALDHTTRDERLWDKKGQAGDNNNDSIVRDINSARTLLDNVHSTLPPAHVSPPPPPVTASGTSGADTPKEASSTTSSAASNPAANTLPSTNTSSAANSQNSELRTGDPAALAGKIISKEIKFDAEDMRALAAQDPQQFSAIMSEIGKKDPIAANTLMQQMQNHIQEINRMFSLLTNITQAQHDTQKSIIQNIRV